MQIEVMQPDTQKGPGSSLLRVAHVGLPLKKKQ